MYNGEEDHAPNKATKNPLYHLNTVQVPLINLISGIKPDSSSVRSNSEIQDSISIILFPSATRLQMALRTEHVTKMEALRTKKDHRYDQLVTRVLIFFDITRMIPIPAGRFHNTVMAANGIVN